MVRARTRMNNTESIYRDVRKNGAYRRRKPTDPSAFNGNTRNGNMIYNPETHPKRAYALISRYGITEQELAMAFGVSGGVITQWKSQHQEFLKAVTDAWYFIKTNGVLKALSRQATGYTLPEEKVFCNIIDGEPIVTRITVNRYYPPVPTATIFWLTNRMKQDWVHMNRLEHTGRDGKPIQTEDKLTQTLLRELLSKSSPEALTTLKDTLEDIVCANSEPL